MTTWRSLRYAAFAVTAGLALTLTACGSDDNDSEPTATAAPSQPTATAATEATGATGSTGAAQPTAANAGPRTIETAFGPVEVPAEPERVVALSELALDVAITVGIEPVGVVPTRLANGVAEYIADEAGDAPVVGTLSEPNLEAIVEADPDLILAPYYYTEDAFKQLNEIAPTIVVADGGFDWRAEGLVLAEALGQVEAYEAALDELDARVEAVSEKVPDGTSAVAIRWLPQGPQVLNSTLMAAALLEEVGFALPEISTGLGEAPHSDPLSLEALSEIDTDWIFIATLNQDGEAAVGEARSQPAFERLPAAQNDQVVSVNGQVWSSAFGPMAAQAVLDDIEATLGE